MKGAERWLLFSDQELAWLARGLEVAEGEGLMPSIREKADPSHAEYVAFAASLEAASNNREG